MVMMNVWLTLCVVGGRFDCDVDPFTDEDFDEDTEEIMESTQVSKPESSCTYNKNGHMCLYKSVSTMCTRLILQSCFVYISRV